MMTVERMRRKALNAAKRGGRNRVVHYSYVQKTTWG